MIKLESKAEFLRQVKSGEYKVANPSTTELQVSVYEETAVATCVWKADETICFGGEDGRTAYVTEAQIPPLILERGLERFGKSRKEFAHRMGKGPQGRASGRERVIGPG